MAQKSCARFYSDRHAGVLSRNFCFPASILPQRAAQPLHDSAALGRKFRWQATKAPWMSQLDKISGVLRVLRITGLRQNFFSYRNLPDMTRFVTEEHRINRYSMWIFVSSGVSADEEPTKMM